MSTPGSENLIGPLLNSAGGGAGLPIDLTTDVTGILPKANGGTNTNNGTLSTVFADNANASITPVLTDANTLIRTTSASAVTFTVPTNASVAFDIGTAISVFQSGAGDVTFSPSGGVTINSSGGFTKLNGQYASAVLLKVDTDVWDLVGNLTI